nr:immunoglobulin heavy chain junction region [Mus musculus]
CARGCPIYDGYWVNYW